MNAKIKQFVNTLSIIFICLLSLGPALTLAADSCDFNGDGTVSAQEAIRCGTNGAGGSTQNPQQASDNVNNTITSVINVLSAVVGVVAVIMIILGGFRYITSGGSSERVTSAKNTLIYAIIGLVVVALAQVLVNFVLDKTINPCVNGKTASSGQKCTP